MFPINHKVFRLSEAKWILGKKYQPSKTHQSCMLICTNFYQLPLTLSDWLPAVAIEVLIRIDYRLAR